MLHVCAALGAAVGGGARDTGRPNEKRALACSASFSPKESGAKGSALLEALPSLLAMGWLSRGVKEGGECGGTGDEDGLLEWTCLREKRARSKLSNTAQADLRCGSATPRALRKTSVSPSSSSNNEGLSPAAPVLVWRRVFEVHRTGAILANLDELMPMVAAGEEWVEDGDSITVAAGEGPG